MRVPVKLLGFGLWLFFLNCARCQECFREKIKYENTEPVARASYADGETVRAYCITGYTGLYRLKCENGEWKPSFERPCASKRIVSTMSVLFIRIFTQISQMSPHELFLFRSLFIVIRCIAPVIPNGYVIEPRTEYQKDATLKYRCNQGFKPRGGIPRCTQFGWTLKPECDEVTCELKSTTFGVKKINPEGKTIFRAGESVEITCSEKNWFFSTKETSRSFTCRNDGQWDYEPVCADITCDYPRDQPVYYLYFVFSGDKKLGAKRLYRCFSGYRETAAEATCTRDGWTPKPLCAEIVCEEPNIPNAEITGGQSENYKFNSRIQYKCHSGFDPEEPVEITCDSRGKWTGIQQCTKMCAAPNIPNAEIVGGQRLKYRFQSRIQYKCHSGFDPEEPVEITCDSRGMWTGSRHCTKMPTLCLKLLLENGFIYRHPSNKEEIFYSCNTGYKPFSGNWWASVTCKKGFQSDEARCIREEECGALPSVHRGKLTLRDPETADVECDPGFVTTDRFIKCINGNWEKPVCKGESLRLLLHVCNRSSCFMNFNTLFFSEGVPCGIPPNVKNAVITSKPEESYPDGSSLTYECQSPYSISGERTVSCRNGTWEKTPTCQGEVLLNDNFFTCPDPQVIQHALFLSMSTRFTWSLSPRLLHSNKR
uniref:Sushi domain-containing protein n=1 Tax=Cyprinus carpio TaxID=7962 RepID=A0A8C1TE05_CYPCA